MSHETVALKVQDIQFTDG